MDVVFRADASTEIGSGHVMRCLTLASALAQRNIRCGFVCLEMPGNLISRIELAGFPVLSLPLSDNRHANFADVMGPHGVDCLKKGHPPSGQAGKSRRAKSLSKGQLSFQTKPNWNELFDYQVPLDWPSNSTTTIAKGITALRKELGWDASKQQSDADSDHPVGQHRLRPSTMCESAIESRIDWLIIDHYSIDWRWEQAIRTYFKQLMVIDDKADRYHDCDLLLDQNLVDDWQIRYQGKVPDRCRLMLGPSFALLQPEYAKLRAAPQQKVKVKDDVHSKPHRKLQREPLRRIFVYFGAADQKNITLKVLSAIQRLGRSDLVTDVVTCSKSIDDGRFAMFTEANTAFHFHYSLPTLAPLLAQADFAIGGGGATTWERCCLGVPSLVISIADNQQPIAESLHRYGLIRYLGDQDDVDESKIAVALNEVLEYGIDDDWQQRCLDLVDGCGTNRVVDCIMLNQRSPLLIRDVETSDERLVFDWANDIEVRKNSFQAELIDWVTHQDWFKQKLRDRSISEFWIVQSRDGLELAQIRFDRIENSDYWRLNYLLARHARGIGLATPIVKQGLQRLRTKYSRAIVVAEVAKHNLRSAKVLEGAGFELIEDKLDRLVFQIA